MHRRRRFFPDGDQEQRPPIFQRPPQRETETGPRPRTRRPARRSSAPAADAGPAASLPGSAGNPSGESSTGRDRRQQEQARETLRRLHSAGPAPAAGPDHQRPDTSDRRRRDRQQQRKTDGKRGKRAETGRKRDRGRVYRGPGTAPGLHFFQDRAGNGPQGVSGTPGPAPPASVRAGFLRRRNKGAPPQSGTGTEEKLLSLSAPSIRISISDLDFGFGG